MGTKDLGKVVTTTKGDYNPSLPYEILDEVRSENKMYRSLKNNNTSPLTDTTAWFLFSEGIGTISDNNFTDAEKAKVDGAVQTTTYTQDQLDKLNKIKQNCVYARAISDDVPLPLHSLDTARKALQRGVNGTIKIAFVGDSITEGSGLYSTDDSFPSSLMNRIRGEFPLASITWQNFGLGGRDLATFISTNYKATNPETDTATNYWRPWATVGQSWIDAVKAFEPDLLIVEFGMNDAYRGGDSDYTFYGNLTIMQQMINGWSKVPSIVLVPGHLPTTNTQLYPQRQDVTQALMRTIKAFARANSYVCADANRFYKILRDGVDDVSRQAYSEVISMNYPTGWDSDTSAYTLSGSNLSPVSGQTNKLITRDRYFYNGTITAKIICNADGAAGSAIIKYRNNDIGGLIVTVTSGPSASISLSYSGNQIATQNITLATGTEATVKIYAKNNAHSIYLNDNLIINVTTAYDMRDGYISIGGAGTLPTFNAPTVVYEDSIGCGAIFAESELLNGINHLNALGYAMCYGPAFNSLLNGLAIPYPRGIQTSRNVASTDLAQTSNTHLGETVYYVTLAVASPFDTQMPMALQNTATGEIFRHRPDLYLAMESLGHHEFTYKNVDATHDQLIIQTESSANFTLYQFPVI